jgi:EAL domain-containing protein (putative c-di-GMP-specific phosphodiesterase class I)
VSNRHYLDVRAPLCFVVDKEESHRHFLSLALQSYGIETALFSKPHGLREGLSRRTPDLIFLDVSQAPTETVESVKALAERSYRGPVQLMSDGAEAAVAEQLGQLGQRSALRILPALPKPVDRAAIRKVVRENQLDGSPAVSGQIGLDEALSNNWLEFWYQPKIDLRKKQLAGVETFARVRHPQHGIMLPGAFMESATEQSLIDLTERSIVHALKTGVSFSKIGIAFRLAVNVTVTALLKIPLTKIVREFRREGEEWPGLILDVTEDQIASHLPACRDFMAEAKALGIQLAIDDFGRGFLPLARMNEISFAELKLDRAFVTDCASDKKHAAICKTIVDLAHNFEATAVAVGVEKPADAHTLFRMGCDFGQGYLFAQPMAQDRFITLLKQRAEMARARPAAATSAG